MKNLSKMILGKYDVMKRGNITEKNSIIKKLGLVMVVLGCMFPSFVSYAKAPEIAEKGVYADDFNLEGMDAGQITTTIESEVERRGNANITLNCCNGNQVVVTAADLGLKWTDKSIVKEAVSLGKTGNVIQRYKDKKDLQRNNQVYPIAYGLDTTAIATILAEQCAVFNQPAINATMKRVDGGFDIVPGQTGYALDESASNTLINDTLTKGWDGNDIQIDLVIAEDIPQGKAEDLNQVRDLLGTFTTNFSTSGASRSANVTNGCNLINGRTLYPGEEFSTYEAIAPFSEANGYFLAGSYLNGQVVESLGGGICQVSTTLYNAVLLSELEVTERHNHSMIIGYVDPSADAAISESAGKDFRFVNNTDYPIYIEGYTANKHITFNIYGVETRPASHSVSYKSEVLERDEPTVDKIYTDGGQPAGWYGNSQSAHVGYKARLWKITTENGVETEREVINNSVYSKSPRSITIGVATADPNVYNALMAAAESGSAAQAIAVAQSVAAGQPVEAPAPAEAPAEAAPEAPAEQSAEAQAETPDI